MQMIKENDTDVSEDNTMHVQEQNSANAGGDNQGVFVKPTNIPGAIVRRRQCNLRGCVIIVAGCLIHLTLGTLYSYGNFSPYIISYIRRRSSPSDLRYVDGIWVQACMMIGQGITMFGGGLLERKLGPRITTLIGSWIMSLGVMLSYFAIQNSYIATVFTYGVMFGMGTGIAYPIPLGCAMKWLPDWRGLVSGSIIAGFGAGALVFNQVITAYVNPENYSPDDDNDGENYFSQDVVLDRVPHCFLVLGGTYAVVQLFSCLMLVDPPEDSQDEVGVTSYKTVDEMSNINEGFSGDMEMTKSASPEAAAVQIKDIDAAAEDVPPQKVLKSKNFYLLWLIFLFGGEGIVFVSSQYKNYGQTFIDDDHFLAIVGSVSSVFNAGGSIFWGYIMDRFSFKIAARCIYIAFACLIASFLGCEYAGRVMFFIWVCLIFFAFSGIFAIMPPAIARMYGNTYVGVNFGLLFTSQIITGATSAFLGQILKDSIGWHGLFFLSTGFTAAGFIIIFFLKTKTSSGDDF
ncbi:L-lactate transporter-like [Haliotis rufescens]|uniref:L-lactate transporter-like n=1 Tax=Haliotis rufescens TaxID=6454 RepID=UPI00201E7C38|nr:L-lactate transporter-like [Haliotis rufescens]